MLKVQLNTNQPNNQPGLKDVETVWPDNCRILCREEKKQKMLNTASFIGL